MNSICLIGYYTYIERGGKREGGEREREREREREKWVIFFCFLFGK